MKKNLGVIAIVLIVIGIIATPVLYVMGVALAFAVLPLLILGAVLLVGLGLRGGNPRDGGLPRP